MAEDSALTRFANSEIHQNVAETNVTINLRVVVGKRVGVASTGPDRRRGPAPAGRERHGDRPGRRGARRLGRAARPDRDPRRPGGLQRRPPPARAPEFRAEAVRAVIGAADDAGVTAYGSFATGTRIDRGRQLGRRAGGRDADDLAAHHRLDGAGRRQRLRRGGRRGRLDDRRGGARPRGRREGAARRRTRSRSSPATTRSCSRSTPSSTSSTCSATSGSRRSPSRRSAASSSSASGSAATS